jgi:hypothetical protein
VTWKLPPRWRRIDQPSKGRGGAAPALRLFSECPAGFGYLLKDRVLDVDDFSKPFAASPQRDPRSTLTSSRSSSDAAVRTARLRRLTPREREDLELKA